MMYQAGDKVLIVDYITERMDGYEFEDCVMSQYCGKIMTIDYVDESDYGNGFMYTMLEDSGAWAWFGEMIEKRVHSAGFSLKTTRLPDL